MVKKTQWTLLFTTFVLSVFSLIFLIVTYSVDEWIRAEAANSLAFQNSKIHYGLFSGSLTRYILATAAATYKLTITCLYEENACIYSCQSTQTLRDDELRRILAGEPLETCPTVFRSTNLAPNSKNLSQTDYSGTLTYSRGWSFVDLTKKREAQIPRQYIGNVADDVIDPGLWLTTVIFLSVTVAFSLFSAVMAVVNIVFNPIQPIFSVFGLYIWNGVASGTTVLTLILWGTLFGSSVSRNIAVTDTLQSELTFNSNGLAILGYCYWLLFIPMLFHSGNIGILYWRKRIIEAEPPPPTINVDKNDFTIMLY